MTIHEGNTSSSLIDLFRLCQGDIICFELMNLRFALCERVHDELVVLRVEDEPFPDFHPDNFRRDPFRGAVLVDHLLPVIDTRWIHFYGQPRRFEILT